MRIARWHVTRTLIVTEEPGIRNETKRTNERTREGEIDAIQEGEKNCSRRIGVNWPSWGAWRPQFTCKTFPAERKMATARRPVPHKYTRTHTGCVIHTNTERIDSTWITSGNARSNSSDEPIHRAADHSRPTVNLSPDGLYASFFINFEQRQPEGLRTGTRSRSRGQWMLVLWKLSRAKEKHSRQKERDRLIMVLRVSRRKWKSMVKGSRLIGPEIFFLSSWKVKAIKA